MPASEDFADGWLRGFFDGEGSVFLKTREKYKTTTYMLSVGNTDLALMAQCSAYLDQLGIRHTKFRQKEKQRNYKDGYNRKPMFVLHICRAEAIKVFAEKVGFASPDKAMLLSLIVDWINRDKLAFRKERGEQIYNLHQQGNSYRKICDMLGYKQGSTNYLIGYKNTFLEEINKGGKR